ncbi:MAG: hypothetical protein JWL77_2209 [Chthonomonadaceae bacterium]|nr:hypothetical protein [Chthonomonadaceae bacterium]
MKKILFMLGCIVLGALVGLGCGGGSASNGPVTSTSTTSNSLVFTVSTPHRTYARGAAIPIPITFTVVNTGTQAANLTVGSCDDFVVLVSQGTQQVWLGPHDACVGIIRSVSIAAGATQTYNATWNQTDSQGNAIGAGTYILLGKFTPLTLNGAALNSAQAATFSSDPISINIAP